MTAITTGSFLSGREDAVWIKFALNVEAKMSIAQVENEVEEEGGVVGDLGGEVCLKLKLTRTEHNQLINENNVRCSNLTNRLRNEVSGPLRSREQAVGHGDTLSLEAVERKKLKLISFNFRLTNCRGSRLMLEIMKRRIHV